MSSAIVRPKPEATSPASAASPTHFWLPASAGRSLAHSPPQRTPRHAALPGTSPPVEIPGRPPGPREIREHCEQIQVGAAVDISDQLRLARVRRGADAMPLRRTGNGWQARPRRRMPLRRSRHRALVRDLRRRMLRRSHAVTRGWPAGHSCHIITRFVIHDRRFVI